MKHALERIKEEKKLAKELVAHVKAKDYALATTKMQNLKRQREYTEAGTVFGVPKEAKKAPATAAASAPVVVCNCPMDDCRGFVTGVDGGALSCGICQVLVCKKCLVVMKDDSHGCNPDDLASALEIKKSSKPCPKCTAPISKIDGCDQMWCVQCKTAFSYTSGKVVNGPVHNPHYYEWLRKNTQDGVIPRAAGDVAGEMCQRLPDFQRICASFNTDAVAQNAQFFQVIHRFIGEIVTGNVENGVGLQPTPPDNSDARVAFLRKEIDEPELGRIAQRRDKEYNKKLEMFNILDTFKLAGMEIFRRCVKPSKSIDLPTSEQLKKEFFEVIRFTNNNLQTTAKVYSSTLKQVTLLKRGEWKGVEFIEGHPVEVTRTESFKETYFKLY